LLTTILYYLRYNNNINIRIFSSYYFIYIGIINYKLITITEKGLEKVIKWLVQQKAEVKSTQEVK